MRPTLNISRVVMWFLLVALTLSLNACGRVLGGRSRVAPPSAPIDDGGGDAAGEPWLRGQVTDVTSTRPVTTDCVSEADPDGDGTVSSDDPPVCNPNPDSYGTLAVKGRISGQPGKEPASVHVAKDVPLLDGYGDAISWGDIAAGSAVDIWITGEVMESYPVQVNATKIVVTGQGVAENARGSGAAMTEPPGATLVWDGGKVRLAAYTYCWSDGGGGVCADGVPSDEKPSVRVAAGTQATLSFDGGVPDSLEVSASRGAPEQRSRSLEVADDGTIVLDLPLGDWYLNISTTWPEGDAHYAGAVAVAR